ncbi:MAG: tetratricopeptide repeat protein [Phycisphaerales bacterium]
MTIARVIALATLVLASSAMGRQPADAASEDRPIEATSLLGEPLRRPATDDAQLATLEKNLADAQAALEKSPDDEMAWIWVGRRLAYLGRYREAIDLYTKAIEKFPESYKLRRHRGHRYITIREFAKAETELDWASKLAADHPDEIEPDGIPNERNQPRSTTDSNIWYHLALARYLQGRFREAGDTFERCLRYARNDDMIVATRYWLFLSRQRDGVEWDDLEQILLPIDADMDIVENHAYQRLLLLFKGQLLEEDLMDGLEPGGVEFSTIAYGVARDRALEGDERGCHELLEKIVADDTWPAFGHIAAEADLAREREETKP